MKLVAIITIALTSSLFLSSCSSMRINYPPGKVMAKNIKKGAGGLVVEVVWVKNKKDTLDMQLIMKNQYENPIELDSDNWTLTFNNQQGSQRSSSFPLVIQSGALLKGVIVYNFYPDLPKEGTVKLVFKKIKGGKDYKKMHPDLVLEFPFKRG